MINKITFYRAYEKYLRDPSQGTSVKHALLFTAVAFLLAFFTSALLGLIPIAITSGLLDLIPTANFGFTIKFMVLFQYFLGTYFMIFGIHIGWGCLIRFLDIRDYGSDSYTTEDGFGKPIVGMITCAVFLTLSVFYFYNFWQIYHFLKLLTGN